VLLVNTNFMKPLVGPLALDYLSASLHAHGIPSEVLDLALEADPGSAISRSAASLDPSLVAVTVRNTDDCYFATKHFLLPELKTIANRLKEAFEAPLVIGGAGYSIFPREAMRFLETDFGIHGEGEWALPRLAEAIPKKDFDAVPGLLWRQGDQILSNPREYGDLGSLRLSPRAWVDNPSYYRLGGMAGLETTRGCSGDCAYCADPLSKGSEVRLRNPKDVREEANHLLKQGVEHFHLCDSECNLVPDHLSDICAAFSSLSPVPRWYTYAKPSPFSREMARSMAVGGCAGINFGVDALDDGMLKRLGRDHTVSDVTDAVTFAKENHMRVMLDLLLCGPGETVSSLRNTIEYAKNLPVDCVGLSIGLRVYPGTRLCDLLQKEKLLEDSPSDPQRLLPTFFTAPGLPEDPIAFVAKLVQRDERFLLPFSEGKNGYNYDDNDTLTQAIQGGERGAFWDILIR